MMKRMIALALLAGGLGVWAGFRAGTPASGTTPIEVGLALLFTANLIFATWVWYRARPGSGDAVVLPLLVVVSGSMLVGIVPRLLWPGHEGMHIAGSVVSIALTGFVVATTVRRSRQLRAKQ